MIVSERHGDNRSEFEDLLRDTKSLLDVDAQLRIDVYVDVSPTELENLVFQKMCEAAAGTYFENKIKLISGHTFPDIVIDIFGVEVKSSHGHNWKSTANSVLESTRAENIDFVYILFAKLSEPIEFKYRLYQECIYDIAVTHSPRYLIDLNLDEGDTIFDKMRISYDDLRTKDNPISFFVNYYRSISKPGEEPWWMETGDLSENIVKPTITLWNKLPQETKNKLRLEMMVRFPRLFGNSTNKFGGPASYLVAKYGVVNSSFRDLFTAGGKVSINVAEMKFIRLPKIYQYLHRDFTDIIEMVKNLPLTEAQFYWQLRNLPKQKDLYRLWKAQVFDYAIRDELTLAFLETLFDQYEEE